MASARKESMIMVRFKSSAALLALAASVSACGPVTNGITPISNPSLYSANQPVVQRTDYVLDLASTGAGLPLSERARLSDWFETLQLGYGDRISIDEAGGYADARGRQDVADVAAEYGLLLQDGAPITAGAVQPGAVRVIVSRTVASVPGCPIWEDELVGAPERTSTNYGCATNSNLAAMIADPNDLVLGQIGRGSGDAADAAKSVGVYRNRTPSGTGGALKSESKGK
jgi:pilus assembly protein CpaD